MVRFSFGKKNQKNATAQDVVDLSGPLSRALNNPLRDPNPTASLKPSEELVASLSAIEATCQLLEDVQGELEKTMDIVREAKGEASIASRALLAEKYDDMRQSIADMVFNAPEEAHRLTAQHMQSIVLPLGNQTSYTIDPVNLDISETGLNLPAPSDAFSEDREVDRVLESLEQAAQWLDENAADYLNDARFLLTRLDKTGLSC